MGYRIIQFIRRIIQKNKDHISFYELIEVEDQSTISWAKNENTFQIIISLSGMQLYLQCLIYITMSLDLLHYVKFYVDSKCIHYLMEGSLKGRVDQ